MAVDAHLHLISEAHVMLDVLARHADIVGDLRALRELGVTAIDVEVEGHDEAATVANMRRFKDTIFALV